MAIDPGAASVWAAAWRARADYSYHKINRLDMTEVVEQVADAKPAAVLRGIEQRGRNGRAVTGRKAAAGEPLLEQPGRHRPIMEKERGRRFLAGADPLAAVGKFHRDAGVHVRAVVIRF